MVPLERSKQSDTIFGTVEYNFVDIYAVDRVFVMYFLLVIVKNVHECENNYVYLLFIYLVDVFS